MSSLIYTRDYFLWCMSAIYLFAFASLYVQIPGLYGDNGLLPARLALGKEAKSWHEYVDGQPTLLRLLAGLGVDVQTGMDLLCLIGLAVSFFCVVSKSVRDVLSFSLLWILYLSLYQVGQTFLWFQWDILLLETGFLTMIIAPFNLPMPRRLRMRSHHQHDHITMWLVKWLLFRLMFASGVVKLTSRCPTWWGLTALTVHFESQCIPTGLAWFWHHLPTWFLKLSCVATYVIEIPVPFLFFSPVRSMRIFAFFAQVFLQLLIIITGNYNFFNLLTLVLCLSLVDDKFFSGGKGRSTSRIESILGKLFSLAVYSYLGYQTWKYFSLSLKLSPFSIESEIAFTEAQYFTWVAIVVPWTIVIGAVSLGYEILLSILRCALYESNALYKLTSSIQCILFGAVAVAMFSVSLIPHTDLDNQSHHRIPRVIHNLHNKMEHFQVTSSYGLFRVMTGVGGRPEVVIEGSNKMKSGWKEYEFYYKPGNVSRIPPIVAPHQPRLDWQMWFAALGSYQHNPWFVNLVYRLLSGQKEVLELIQHNPFPGKPPKFIRAKLYHYHYTQNSQKGKKWYSAKDWWVREEKSEFFPPIDKSNPSLVEYLKNNGFLHTPKKTKKSANANKITSWIKWVRGHIGQPEGFTFVMSLFGSSLVVNILNSLYSEQKKEYIFRIFRNPLP